jgi:glycosyltransferase involved in cell wall biosynthesis
MGDAKPLLTVIIPFLNEARTINEIVSRVVDLEIDLEIILVDDGSTDDTVSILQNFLNEKVRLLSHTENRGKGAAIRTALPHIQGKYTVIQDGDLEYDPADFVPMLDVMQTRKAQVVYGSRILSHSKMSYLRYWLGGRGVTFFTNLLYGSRLTDEPTCYKMFSSELLKSLNLQSTGFEFCPEVTAKILSRKISILEIPISYDPRSIEDGKKIRWRDGFIALWVLLKHRFSG